MKEREAFADAELYRRQWISLLRGRPAEALEDLDELQRRRPCSLCNLRERTAAFEALRQSDSAIAALERWVKGDGFDHIDEREVGLGAVLPQLAGLYEQVGRLDDARAAWLRFADRWADADEVLQPRVRAARARAEALAAGGAAGSEEPDGGGG
jgi:tetratricopeptide (TPR) repeat protein